MQKTRLLPALCGLSLLVATPAFAQRSMQGNDMQDQSNGSGYGAIGMSTSQQMSDDAGMPRSRQMRSSRAGRGGDAQNSEVDRLNEQSLQAAQQGQSFNGPTGTGTMPATGSTSGYGASGGGYGTSPGMSGAGAGGSGTMQRGSAAPGTTPTR